jgi:hypothetical protein
MATSSYPEAIATIRNEASWYDLRKDPPVFAVQK